MDSGNRIRLVVLSAIWGASFLFIRIAAPVLGAVPLMALRVAIAAVVLAAAARVVSRPLPLRGNARYFLMLGALNSALPFVLFAFAAKTLTASLMSILNATAPAFGALIAAVGARRLPSLRVSAGLVAGISGVAILAGGGSGAAQAAFLPAIAAVLAAACCYALAGFYARSAGAAVEPFCAAHGSMWAATLWLAPPALFLAPAGPIGNGVWIAVALLGAVCTAFAYALYFRLLRDVGPASALTVTFLIPVFGVLWGVIFLDEPLGWHMLAGAVLVLAGTAAVTGVDPGQLLARARK
ncbi:MAG: DMT family transporter [Rhodocyclaceae bacterium]